MRITVLTVPDCPNGPVVEARIAEAPAGRAVGVEPVIEPVVERVVVRDEAAAVRHGMAGSPTVPVDGEDPFAGQGAVPSLSCRVYREAGRTDGAPSVAALRAAPAADGEG
ncbi:hypothetical protein ABZO31_30995 [Streptomyces sp. HUAS MG47]|uniref:alkylmercury lyase n=1 Tax=Streptomyces solicamelliae TaxID=3231716 RepID=UPI00387798B8